MSKNVNHPARIGVVVTTYNSPEWLRKVLLGYEYQQDRDFKILIADDGSDDRTREMIESFKESSSLNIEHYWQEDDGFRKTVILNKVIAATDCDYLIFTDGDCIPRADFVSTHRFYAEQGYFLSGGYIKLNMVASEAIDTIDISSQAIFDIRHLTKIGQVRSHKLLKLVKPRWLKVLLNSLTPTKATWNGMNSSAWLSDIVRVNGFDERMQYGGLDRELGERLWNAGLKSRQLRYSAICLHLDHPRGYSKPEVWARNNSIRAEVKEHKLTWTRYGVVKDLEDD